MSMNIIDIDARPVFVTGLIHKDPQINFSGGSFIDFAGDGTDLMVSAEGRLTTVTVSDVVINLSNEFIFILQRAYMLSLAAEYASRRRRSSQPGSERYMTRSQYEGDWSFLLENSSRSRIQR